MAKILVLGATSAIAKECCRIWSENSKNWLILVGRNVDALKRIQQDLLARGCEKVSVEVADFNQLDLHGPLLERVWSQTGDIDVCLLAHGVLGNQKKAEQDQNELLNIIMSNYVSHVSLLNLLAEKMKLQKKGVIAVITSVAADRGKQSNYVYGSAKAGKSTFVDGLRNALYQHGVHVVNLKQGFVDTPMTAEFPKGPLWAQPGNVAKSIVSAIEHKKDVVYIPGFWSLIMFVIRSIPEGIFKRLKL
jgi:hypothetical protein